jgi:hypothetical protein
MKPLLQRGLNLAPLPLEGGIAVEILADAVGGEHQDDQAELLQQAGKKTSASVLLSLTGGPINR